MFRNKCQIFRKSQKVTKKNSTDKKVPTFKEIIQFYRKNGKWLDFVNYLLENPEAVLPCAIWARSGFEIDKDEEKSIDGRDA